MSEELPVPRPRTISRSFEAIKNLLEQVTKANGEEVPSMYLGADMEAEATSTPSIVWILLGGPVTASRQTAADGYTSGGPVIREIAERHERILVKIWGEDFGSTDRLMNHFVAACRELETAYSFKALSTDWTEGQGARSGLGRLCKLEIELSVPFTSEPLAISAPPHTLGLAGNINAPQ